MPSKRSKRTMISTTEGALLATAVVSTALNVFFFFRSSRSAHARTVAQRTDAEHSPAAPPVKRKTSHRQELERLASNPSQLRMDAPSMEEIVKMRQTRDSHVRAKPPLEILAELKAGNARFWTGTAVRPELNAMERRALILQQAPKVAVLGCADSRVPIEIVFDQGLGDVFAIRVAGNLHKSTVAASIDYAVHHLEIKLVVVLGHEGCGAVKAAQLDDDVIQNEPPHLREMLQGMKADLEPSMAALKNLSDARARDREAVTVNTMAQVRGILSDERLKAKVDAGELLVVGAFYEITSGLVDFHNVELSDADWGAAADDASPRADDVVDVATAKAGAPRSGGVVCSAGG